MDFDKPIFDKVIFDKSNFRQSDFWQSNFRQSDQFQQNCSVFPIPVLRDRRLDLRDVSKTDLQYQ